MTVVRGGGPADHVVARARGSRPVRVIVVSPLAATSPVPMFAPSLMRRNELLDGVSALAEPQRDLVGGVGQDGAVRGGSDETSSAWAKTGAAHARRTASAAPARRPASPG